jgi:hypothetical protein
MPSLFDSVIISNSEYYICHCDLPVGHPSLVRLVTMVLPTVYRKILTGRKLLNLSFVSCFRCEQYLQEVTSPVDTPPPLHYV